MKRTKASFKAIRESLGMSQQLLADLLGVNVRSVKRWENPDATDYGVAPGAAWDLLNEYLARQEWAVETGLQKVDEMEATIDGTLNEVSLTYWHNEAEYEQAHPGEGKFWQMANANSRLTAAILRMDGYAINFDFPGLKAIQEKRAETKKAGPPLR